LLCARCNLAIGMFDDDVNALHEAGKYVEHHRRLVDSDGTT
jgi:hypothetical protein